MNIEKYLNEKGIKYRVIKRPAGKQAVFPCPKCGDKNFSINIDTGAYSCYKKNKCGISGGAWKFQRLMGDEPQKIETESTRFIYSRPQRRTTEPDDAVRKFIESRGIDYKLAVRHFKVNKESNRIAFRYFEYGEHIATKFRGLTEKSFTNEKDTKPALYNIDNCRDSDVLYICEGELDCIAFKQLTGMDAVSVPNGTGDSRWIQANWDELESYDKIYLVFDSDIAGQKCVHDISKRLGDYRCFNVVLPTGDVNDFLINKIDPEKLYDAIAKAEPMGEAKVKSASHYTEEIIELMNRPELLYGMKLCSLPTLSGILKGIRGGEVTVLTGKNGSGKTTFINIIAKDIIKNKEKVCIASLEMMPRSYLRWFLMQSLNDPHPSEEKIRKTLDILNDRLYIVDIHKKVTAEEIIEHFMLSYRKYGTRYFFLDSLMKVKLGHNGTDRSRLEAEGNFVDALTDFAKQTESHVFLVAHPRKTFNDSDRPTKMDVKGSGEITDLAHNVISIWRPDEKAAMEYRTVLGLPVVPQNVAFVLKNREHGDLGQALFGFKSSTKLMYELEEQLQNGINN
jgi:twinkle protein